MRTIFYSKIFKAIDIDLVFTTGNPYSRWLDFSQFNQCSKSTKITTNIGKLTVEGTYSTDWGNKTEYTYGGSVENAYDKK